MMSLEFLGLRQQIIAAAGMHGSGEVFVQSPQEESK